MINGGTMSIASKLREVFERRLDRRDPLTSSNVAVCLTPTPATYKMVNSQRIYYETVHSEAMNLTVRRATEGPLIADILFGHFIWVGTRWDEHVKSSFHGVDLFLGGDGYGLVTIKPDPLSVSDWDMSEVVEFMKMVGNYAIDRLSAAPYKGATILSRHAVSKKWPAPVNSEIMARVEERLARASYQVM